MGSAGRMYLGTHHHVESSDISSLRSPLNMEPISGTIFRPMLPTSGLLSSRNRQMALHSKLSISLDNFAKYARTYHLGENWQL